MKYYAQALTTCVTVHTTESNSMHYILARIWSNNDFFVSQKIAQSIRQDLKFPIQRFRYNIDS